MKVFLKVLSYKDVVQDDNEEEEYKINFSENFIKSTSPQKRKLIVKNLDSGNIFNMEASFHWVFSWLRITLEVDLTETSSIENEVKEGRYKFLWYELDDKASIESLLADCKVRLDHLTSLDKNPITLMKFGGLLNDKEEESEELKNIAKMMKETVAGQVFLAAINQTEFFKVAPILFPREINDIISNKKVLPILNKIAMQQPWQFGFQHQTRCTGLEASLTSMMSTYPSLLDVQKTALHMYDVYKQTCKKGGHTYLLHDDLLRYFNSYYGNQNDVLSWGKLNEANEFLITNGIVWREVKGTEERFYLMRYWKAEESVCKSLEYLLLSPNWSLNVDLRDSRFDRIRQDVDQLTAAKSILKNAVTVISGRGGTGKTEVVSAVLKAAEEVIKSEIDEGNDLNTSEDGVSTQDESNGPILYCAPTGKAASVIKKRVGSNAYTISQILSSYKLWRLGGKITPWKFEKTRIVALDECSMVNLEDIQLLLNYLIKSSQLQKIVLLGDHLQLPSVDPGNFMEDIFQGLISRGLTVTLSTNHRSEGHLIFDNAIKISKRQMPILNEEFRLIVPNKEIRHHLPKEVREKANKLVPYQTPPLIKIKEDKSDMNQLKLYWTLLSQYKEAYNFENDEKSQIISFKNDDLSILNQFGCLVYANHSMWEEGEGRKKQFSVGDKVMCTKNADVSVHDQEVKSERLMNGNVYKIRAICNPENDVEDANDISESTKNESFVLDDLTGVLIQVSRDDLIKRTKITHAYALSIHKFQGSEADTVIYVLSGSNHESWRHVYTAVTRGKKNIVIVGRYQDLEKAIKRKPLRRQTALAEKVRKLMGIVTKKKQEEVQKALKRKGDGTLMCTKVMKSE